MLKILNTVFWGNSIYLYFIFICVLAVGALLVSLIASIAFKKIGKKGKSESVDKETMEAAEGDVSRALLKNIKRFLMPIAYVAVLYFSLQILYLHPRVARISNVAFFAVSAFIGALFLSAVAVFLFSKYWSIKHDGEQNDLISKWISIVIKIVIWSIALLLFLDNIGVEITTLVAGFGIGGLAIALAAQTILSDIFCYFTIAFDRPFIEGDFIIVGDKAGVVEHIGIKTTRIRNIAGEQMVFSNQMLTSSIIHNFKTMEKRRIVFRIGVTYDTPAEKMKEIPDLIRVIFDSEEQAELSRVHFVDFGASSLDYEIVYFVPSGDYTVYLDLHQALTLKIKEEFDQQGIEFAFPTQTIHLVTGGND